MEGNPEESDKDVQGEDKSLVLWEKCIEQSIFVDLSEDESLHFSDLENNLPLHLSQAESAASEPSIHLSGSAALSALDDSSSESSIVSSQSERLAESKTKSSILHVSAQRPNTMQDEPPLNRGFEDPGQNTSDEDQDDLPYDGELGSPYFNQTAGSDGNMSSDGRETVHTSPDAPGLLELTPTESDDTTDCLILLEHNTEKSATLSKEDASTRQGNICDAYKTSVVAPSCPSPADINQLLLQHFSQEELLQSSRLIEAETLPEVSLLESVDDTAFSSASIHNSLVIHSNSSRSPACKINQSFCSGMTEVKSNTASKNSRSEEEPERKIDNVISAATDSIAPNSASRDSNRSSGDNSAVDVVKDQKGSKVPLVRTRSLGEMKYGQGQVHYPLPDFSKVAPKVKIPKAPSGPARPVPQSPSTMHRAQSPLGMLELISRVLEDSVQSSDKPYVFKGEDKQTPPASVNHLQAEYDKLLTKYAEAENLIDQMRLGTNIQPSSEPMLYLDAEYPENLIADDLQRNSLTSHLPLSENLDEKGAESNITEVNITGGFATQPEEVPSDGERMTAELRDIITQFMHKVKEFKFSVSDMSVSTAEQQMMLRSMVEAQDQLERKYISKKEEHRALEMQNYMGLSRNTGTFDPNRLVEGDIFRIGMHLEDIKEMLDKNMCEQISPPHSS
nr:protein AKNAD1-like [Monopterus albus]